MTMITYEQARQIVIDGEVLMDQLATMDREIRFFESVVGDTVQCVAFPRAPGEGPDWGRFGGSAYIELLPHPKSEAISALQRKRSKIVAKLAELGIDANAATPQAN